MNAYADTNFLTRCYLLHVSAALLLGCDSFWSFDAKASKLAALEGLATPVAKTR
ncbi:MAG: hypothetical protein HY360_06100 [Verrucomicrobia bacterium]|nr:hypothetical protein [Verrucomicrobiota bacterium]